MNCQLTSELSGMFWSGWTELGRVLVVGTLTYIAAILLLRGAGQQALTKMTAYGFLVTIALGSVLATALLSSQVKLDKAVLAFGLLLMLQRILAWLSAKVKWIQSLVSNEPELLMRDGQYLEAAMRRTNITREELDAALRSSGREGRNDISAVILETDGSLSVLPTANLGDGTALNNIGK